MYSYLHHPSRLGLATALAAGVAVLLLCAIFQFVVPAHDVSAYVPANPGNVNLRALILYAAAGGAHVLLCSLGIAILFFRVRVAEPNFRKITVDFTIAFSVIIAVVVLGCYLNLRVVQQSYFETIQPLQGDPRFGHLLGEHRIPLIAARFQLFAIFPLVLIAFGAAIAIVACFWVSQRMVDFVRTADGLKEAEIMEMKRDVAQLVSMISAIFTTSTVSTIALLQLGRDWIEKGPSRDAYIGNGYAMSIFWSVCYTTIIVLMIFVPLFWAWHQFLRIHGRARNSGSQTAFYEIISYKFISQTGAAMLMPIFTSSIAAVFGS